ncbi:MAG: potassium-transporting ATPase subunit KdpA [Nitrospinae bacterium]|nr:potassium-transporting ATPase subunit KdpA [Nitrospinota bacterium]
MTINGLLQIAFYLTVLLALVKPLGLYIAKVFMRPAGEAPKPEKWIYRICGVNESAEMSSKTYALAAIVFNAAGFCLLFIILSFQTALPLNPDGMGGISWHLAFNTAASFITNTNWQSYGGESTMSYFSQMVGLTVQNFLSAASGMAILIALIRGFARHSVETIGNFWVDMIRSAVYILLPLSLMLALALVWQGMPQTFTPHATAQLVEPTKDDKGSAVTEQMIALGPVASQVAIKQLGTNGGGYFNANSAHPFENPTPLSNFLMMLSLLLIPAALCYTFGVMVGDRRQGWAVLAAMAIVFVFLLGVCAHYEQSATPMLVKAGADIRASDGSSGGNTEGKEVRFGIVNSAIYATATTAASNGSVNAMHDSFTPLGGLVSLWLMQLGEIIFGGVGSGLYGMIVFAIVAVFIAGLMVGRTPEYIRKKIEAHEMKMASLAALIPIMVALIGTAVALIEPSSKASMANPGAHGYGEVLYAFSSAANNNGSAFAGLNANTPFFNISLGLAMLIGRFGCMLPVIAIAGSLAAKKSIPVTSGTMPTHGPIFVALLIAVVLMIGALSFFPALALGPIVEHLMMIQ